MVKNKPKKKNAMHASRKFIFELICQFLANFTDTSV